MLEALFVFVAVVIGSIILHNFTGLLFGLVLWVVPAGVAILILIIILPGIYAMLSGAPFVITTKLRLQTILDFGKFKRTDVVYDLGCGDGRIIREIAKVGVKKAMGFELSVPTYLLAKFRTYLNRGHEQIYLKNFWKQNYDDADVIVCFLLPKPLERIKKEIWPKLKRGARLISNDFELPGVKADKELHRVFLYIKK